MEAMKNIHNEGVDSRGEYGDSRGECGDSRGECGDSRARRPCSLFLDRNGLVDEKRRNLPHWEQGAKLQFVTFRLGDSLPQSELRRMREEKDLWIKTHPLPWSKETEAEYHQTFSQHIDKWLDSGEGCCMLRDKRLAQVVESAMLFFDQKRYSLHAYVVMPNHVHALIEEYSGYPISTVMHSWKSYTAKQINAATGNKGKVWAEEYYDRILRDERHYVNVIAYIQKNIRQGGIIWREKEEYT